jgi:hypothetical protein
VANPRELQQPKGPELTEMTRHGQRCCSCACTINGTIPTHTTLFRPYFNYCCCCTSCCCCPCCCSLRW